MYIVSLYHRCVLRLTNTVLFYSEDECTLDNIASLLSVTKKHAELSSMHRAGKIMILKLFITCMPSYIDYHLMSINYVTSPSQNL